MDGPGPYATPAQRAFVEECRKVFGFLETEFGFRFVDVEGTDPMNGMYVRFQNATTGISAQFVVRDGGIDVYVVQLAGGEFPPYPVFWSPKGGVCWAHIRDLIAVRAPPVLEYRNPLAYYARFLRERCADVLRGDFQVFEKVKRIISRRCEPPQGPPPRLRPRRRRGRGR